MKIYYDEAADFPSYKWYRTPIKWWQWRRLMKYIDRQMEKVIKEGTILTSWRN